MGCLLQIKTLLGRGGGKAASPCHEAHLDNIKNQLKLNLHHKMDLNFRTYLFGFTYKSLKCCVFRPANGCSAHCLLVKIICFWVKTIFFIFFPSFTEKRKESAKNNKKNIYTLGANKNM